GLLELHHCRAKSKTDFLLGACSFLAGVIEEAIVSETVVMTNQGGVKSSQRYIYLFNLLGDAPSCFVLSMRCDISQDMA
ncbi:MAG: hypothetical protein WAU96_05845, partial [Anaerolineae bacterium]